MRKTLSIMLVVALTFVCSLAISLSNDFAYAATTSGNIHAKNSTLEQPDSNHVYFGSYPQTEIVGEASQSGVYGKPWSKATDFIEDSELYAELKSAQWDANNDTIINGSRYHKIAPKEITYSNVGDIYYNWRNTPSDHFFKYEPIKWRVLKLTDNDAFLFCDTILYDHKYHSEYVKVSWETSAIRTWLNDTFYNSAFNSAEKNIIKETNVVNSDNVTYGTTGGNDTVDKVFLLSENEVFGQNAVQYGFDGSASTTDSARRMRSSTFAKAAGNTTAQSGDWLGYSYWWLRSPGRTVRSAARVQASGAVDSKGLIVYENHEGVCPAIHIQLKSSNPIAVECSFSEMELSDYNYIYDGNEKKPEVHIEGLTEGIDYTVSYENYIGPGRATAIATGIGAYEGSIVTEYGIGYELPDSISLSDSTYVYDGKEKTPSVTVGDLVEGTDYSVKYSDNTEAGTASVIIEGINNYVGTKTKTFTISQLDIKDASVTVEEAHFIATGNEIRPAVSIGDLVEGRDFETHYYDNIDAGTGSITIIGKGSCKGTVYKTFGIHSLLKTDAIEATCVNDGNKEYWVCSCGKYYSDSSGENEIDEGSWVIEAKGHTYSNWTITKEATCTEDGSKEKVCEVCEDKVTEVIPATGHKWNDEYTVDKEASCTEEGSKSKHCSVCNAIDESTVEPIAKTDHKYGEWNVTKEATCTEDGSKEKVCEVCEDKVTEVIPATGHKWNDEYTVDKEASCTEEGSKSKHCSVCNAIDESTVTVISKSDHNYGDWTVTKEATCTEDGSKEKVCSVCEDKVTEVIPATGHKWNEEYTVDIEASCTEEGSKSIHCSVCNAIDDSTVTVIPKSDHTYGDWKVTKEATCTEDGSKEKVCSVCEDKVTEAIPATGHKWNEEYTIDKEATCTEEGSKSIHCSVCNAIDESTVTVIPKADHIYGDWNVTKEATCTEDGSKEKVCSVCGDKITEVIPAKGHAWNEEYTTDKAATCKEEGSKSIHCSVCDAVDESTVTVIPKADHTYGDWTVTAEATCTEDGSREKVCSVCGDKITEVIPANGHSFSEEFTVDTEPTCTAEGSKSRHCSNCDEVTDITAIPANGHAFSQEFTVDTEPTCTAEGSKSRHCANCDEIIDITAIPKSEHTYGEWKVTAEATCTEDGSKEKVCSVCGDKVIEVIPANGHSFSEEFTVDTEPTCTAEGSKSRHCSNCDEVTDITAIPSNGHSFGSWEVVSASTCENSGVQQRVCDICGFTETQNLDPNGHEWEEEFTVDVGATCTEDGSQSRHCKNCDAVTDSEVIPATGHSGEWIVVKDSTCTEIGSKERVCAVCGNKTTEEIPAKGHSWNSEPTVDKVASCTTAGLQSVHCARCSETKNAETIPALGHNWESTPTVDKAPTCTKDGKESTHCTRCDAIKEGSEKAIPATGHKFSAWETTKQPTELAPGQQSRKCSICGKTETKTIAQLKPTLPAVKITKPKAAKKSATIKWKKVSKANQKKIAKIQIQYSMDKTFKTGVKTVYAKKSAASKKITKLTSKKTYYVRIRAYKKDSKGVHISKWSAVKSVKAK